MSTSIYDLLTGVKIGNVTTGQLDSAASRTYVDTATREFWNPILLLSHVVKAARTYAYGLPIPELGAVWTQEVANGAVATVQPTGTELWQVQNIDLDNCSVAFSDGTTISPIALDATSPNRTFIISNTLYLVFQNASGSSQDPTLAYSKVGL